MTTVEHVAAVMLDGNGGWYYVPGADIQTARFTLPLEILPFGGPHCAEPHPVTGYTCTEHPRHIGAWHFATDGRYLTARWAK